MSPLPLILKRPLAVIYLQGRGALGNNVGSLSQCPRRLLLALGSDHLKMVKSHLYILSAFDILTDDLILLWHVLLALLRPLRPWPSEVAPAVARLCCNQEESQSDLPPQLARLASKLQ